MGKECNHLLGYEDDYDYGRVLKYKSDAEDFLINEHFPYCALCGISLIDQEEG